MASSFTFSFGGDDIEEEELNKEVTSLASKVEKHTLSDPANAQAQKQSHQQQPAATASAFPVPGKPQLPPTLHDLRDIFQQLPSKIAYDLLEVTLDDGSTIELPRRELWDVRVQLMAEAETEDSEGGEGPEGLGAHDIKTGVYEGGFKSWESSVDLVKVLAAEKHMDMARRRPLRAIELGCGTALPSLAIFQWAMKARVESDATGRQPPLFLVLADYNPTVLQLVTLPNFILTWALAHQSRGCTALEGAFDLEGELELTPEVLTAFGDFLITSDISLNFVSGGWSAELMDLIYSLDLSTGPRDDDDRDGEGVSQGRMKQHENEKESETGNGNVTSNSGPTGNEDHETLVLGAETIYSPFALDAFTEMMFAILARERSSSSSRDGDQFQCQALVGAKRMYFGVGGSLDDFIDKARDKGATVTQLREEAEGVVRGVVRCVL
ncbi:hypothetical protein ACRALDRAFT_1074577 [Sodiomyces alcalophilus JCM 7366]|uniref:uncharacterized protein n=1 Tax=Sodiomyces alcalophilus JCM 7366 TaxID=591952 RepID=UPI0039B5071B